MSRRIVLIVPLHPVPGPYCSQHSWTRYPDGSLTELHLRQNCRPAPACTSWMLPWHRTSARGLLWEPPAFAIAAGIQSPLSKYEMDSQLVQEVTVMLQFMKWSKVLCTPALSSVFIDFRNNRVPKSFITRGFTPLIKVLKRQNPTLNCVQIC